MPIVRPPGIGPDSGLAGGRFDAPSHAFVGDLTPVLVLKVGPNPVFELFQMGFGDGRRLVFAPRFESSIGSYAPLVPPGNKVSHDAEGFPQGCQGEGFGRCS